MVKRIEKFGAHKITIELADDHAVVREGIRLLLAGEKDMRVVGEARDGSEAAQLVRQLQPDVLIMDILMAPVDGIEAAREILKENPSVKIVALSACSEAEHVKPMMDLGAKGYMLKQDAVKNLPGAIRQVQKGDLCFDPAKAKHLNPESPALRGPKKKIQVSFRKVPGSKLEQKIKGTVPSA